MPVIGRELGVDGIVEGTVLRTENRVRVSVQLIHAPTDRHLWTAQYDGRSATCSRCRRKSRKPSPASFARP